MMRDFMEFLGLAILVTFTSIIISISIFSQGALVYYYEPNKIVWIVEVLLGICGVVVGIRRIKECLSRLHGSFVSTVKKRIG